MYGSVYNYDVEDCLPSLFFTSIFASIRMGCRRFLDRPYFTEAYKNLQAVYNPEFRALLSNEYIGFAYGRHTFSDQRLQFCSTRRLFLTRNSQIAESFRRFGVTDDSSNLLAIKVFSGSEASASFSTAASNVSKHLLDSVDGKLVDFTNDNIAAVSDLLRIKKIYKLPADSKSTSARPNGFTPYQEQIQQIEAMVLGTMAVKGS